MYVDFKLISLNLTELAQKLKTIFLMNQSLKETIYRLKSA